MSAVTEVATITDPGVYEGLDEATYHRDPVEGGSLSVSGAKKLLPPNCPAKYAWERSNPPLPTDAFTFGHAAHALVLGYGPELVVIDAKNWQTAKAREAKKEALETGKVPLLPHEHAAVVAMADALHEHPLAGVLLDPEHGAPERSLFWTDTESGITRRARLDWLPEPTSGRMIIPDYKTAVSANPTLFAKSAADYGYHQQADWYEEAATALGLAADVAFVFVVQEKTPPYLVTVVELDRVDVEIGRYLNRQAIEIYAECTARDEWPGYSSEVELVQLPSWYRKKWGVD